VYGKERKRNRKVKRKIYICMRKKERKRREKRSGKKDMIGMNQVKEK
jgi:hypothetical protein